MNQVSPSPLTRMAKPRQLNAMAVTTLDPSMPRAASAVALAAAMDRRRKKYWSSTMVWTARTILSLPDAARPRKLGTSSRRKRSAAAAVARVELVAHAERALDDGLERNAGALAERLGDHRDDLVLHESSLSLTPSSYTP